MLIFKGVGQCNDVGSGSRTYGVMRVVARGAPTTLTEHLCYYLLILFIYPHSLHLSTSI